ncbi:unnamed protein product [Brachionus calyciflorus]|uniref:Methylosome subunit pICln n=1 Tax=Brachionus calyciflorus TaxID=104777 RepID=A0A813Z4C9_9BILA|nr:unnamed protein product [Brachionus calyciflorus]
MLPQTDDIKIQAVDTKAFIGEREFGTGVLIISEKNFLWKNNNGSDINLNYPNIALHAISKDLNAFPHECLYLITDHPIEFNEGKVELKEEEDNDSDESDEITPLRFVPADRTLLDPIFKAINECQALYPDEEMSGDEESEEEDDEEVEDDYQNEENQFFDSSSDLNNIQLSDRGQEILRRLNINYDVNADKIEGENQYEDAEN